MSGYIPSMKGYKPSDAGTKDTFNVINKAITEVYGDKITCKFLELPHDNCIEVWLGNKVLFRQAILLSTIVPHNIEELLEEVTDSIIALKKSQTKQNKALKVLAGRQI